MEAGEQVVQVEAGEMVVRGVLGDHLRVGTSTTGMICKQKMLLQTWVDEEWMIDFRP